MDMERILLKIKILAPAIAAGAVLAIPFLMAFERSLLNYGFLLLLIYVLLSILFSVGVYYLVLNFSMVRLKAYTLHWRILWFLGCLLAGFWLANNIPLRAYTFSATFLFTNIPTRLIIYMSGGLGIGLLIFVLSSWLATSRFYSDKPDEIQPWRWLKYALPMLLIWGIYLLAFWPGMMSADSMVQWDQVLTGRFYDHHPAFHTFIIWGLTRFSLTPAVVSIAQILVLGLLAGAILAFIETLGVQRWLLWLASFIFALSPVNGTMVVTLWKDIFYSTAMLALTYFLFRIVYSKGRWLQALSSKIILGISAALVSLLRHSGWPVAIGSLVAAVLAFPGKWKPILVSLGITVLLFLGIRGPVYQLVGVQKSTILLESSLSLYTLAAYTAPDTHADGLFNTIQPLSDEWTCDIWSSLGSSWQEENLDMDIEFATMAGNFVQRIPKVLLYTYSCRRSIVWVIYDPSELVRNPSHTELLIDPNPYGLHPVSKIPELQALVSDLVLKTSRNGDINWLIWRPALYLYLFLFVVAVNVIRHKKIQFFLPAVPLLLQSVATTLVIIMPNFRYHYSAYLIGLIFWPLLFVTGKSEQEYAEEEVG